jgi:hypothetical protein
MIAYSKRKVRCEERSEEGIEERIRAGVRSVFEQAGARSVFEQE